MTPRDLLKATLIVGLVFILSIVGGTLYVLRKIDHFNATLDTMTRESEAEIARLRARIEEARKTSASAAPSTSTSTTPSAGKPDAH